MASGDGAGMSYRPITDVWFLARCKYKGGIKRYGGYLGGFPERARALLAATIDEPVLHVCGGLARLYPYRGGFGPNDKTLDLDPNCQPDFFQDARKELPPGFKAMLADPPYSPEDSGPYFPGLAQYPTPNQIVKSMMAAIEPGRRIGIIGYGLPAQPKNSRFVACIDIHCGFNNRTRTFSVFERTP